MINLLKYLKSKNKLKNLNLAYSLELDNKCFESLQSVENEFIFKSLHYLKLDYCYKLAEKSIEYILNTNIFPNLLYFSLKGQNILEKLNLFDPYLSKL